MLRDPLTPQEHINWTPINLAKLRQCAQRVLRRCLRIGRLADNCPTRGSKGAIPRCGLQCWGHSKLFTWIAENLQAKTQALRARLRISQQLHQLIFPQHRRCVAARFVAPSERLLPRPDHLRDTTRSPVFTPSNDVTHIRYVPVAAATHANPAKYCL